MSLSGLETSFQVPVTGVLWAASVAADASNSGNARRMVWLGGKLPCLVYLYQGLTGQLYPLPYFVTHTDLLCPV